jgi:hypothetical protein
METATPLHQTTTFPKRIRSVSARIFSIQNISDLHHSDNKRGSCQQFTTPSEPTQQQLLKGPSKWFPRIRCRSSSSASSTFSLVFSSTTTSSTTTTADSYLLSSDNYGQHHQSLETLSSELEELYRTAEEEVSYDTIFFF